MRHYITQYGGWWSVNETGWRTIVEHALANNGTYDFDKHAKPLRGRPSSIRIDSMGPRAMYFDIEGHPIHRPLDWTLADWEVALAELTGT